ncbi:hypothetical protein SARC_16557, partial [Sphaeroforma arctica JP610]
MCDHSKDDDIESSMNVTTCVEKLVYVNVRTDTDVESHDQEGRRTSYYQNDHKTSLADMVETERFRDGHDYDTELLNNVSNMNDDYDEDVFRPNMAKSKDQQLDRERHRAIT